MNGVVSLSKLRGGAQGSHKSKREHFVVQMLKDSFLKITFNVRKITVSGNIKELKGDARREVSRF